MVLEHNLRFNKLVILYLINYGIFVQLLYALRLNIDDR